MTSTTEKFTHECVTQLRQHHTDTGTDLQAFKGGKEATTRFTALNTPIIASWLAENLPPTPQCVIDSVDISWYLLWQQDDCALMQAGKIDYNYQIGHLN